MRMFLAFCALLGVVLVTLKLAGKLACSWWLVLSPFWGAGVACLFFLVPMVLVLLWINRLK